VSRGGWGRFFDALLVGLGAITLRCSRCSSAVPPDASFCPGCGARIDWDRFEARERENRSRP
jgi:uncharacterized OB-fold protein